MIVYARLTQFPFALVVSFFISFFATLTRITVKPIHLHVTPRVFLGRMYSVMEAANTLTSMLSALLIGWLRSGVFQNFHAFVLGGAFGPNDTILLVAGVITIIAGGYARMSVRGVRLAKEGKEGAHNDQH